MEHHPNPPSMPAEPGAPEVTVVIPTRNRRRLLERTLDSALRQHRVSLEVIVVDEASEDDTARFLAEYPDERVSTIRNEVPGGVSRARNQGIEKARGRHVAILDDDDLWAPSKLRRLLDRMHADGGRRWAYSSVAFVDDDLRPLDLFRVSDVEDFARAIHANYLVPAGASNVVVERSLYEEVGGFDPGFKHNADWDMWIRLGAAARPSVVDELLVAYVRHRRMVSTIAAGKYEDLALMISKHAEARHRLGAGSPEPHLLRWIGQSSLWADDRRAAFRAFWRAARLDGSPRRYVQAALMATPGFPAALDELKRRRVADVERGPELAWLLPYRAS